MLQFRTVRYFGPCGRDIPPTIKSVLVLQATLPKQFYELAKVLGVKVLENVG
jgi:hypothetical protein